LGRIANDFTILEQENKTIAKTGHLFTCSMGTAALLRGSAPAARAAWGALRAAWLHPAAAALHQRTASGSTARTLQEAHNDKKGISVEFTVRTMSGSFQHGCIQLQQRCVNKQLQKARHVLCTTA
jgi:hypothetical protein